MCDLRLTEVLVARDGGLGGQQAQHGHHLLALGEGAHWTTDSQQSTWCHVTRGLLGLGEKMLPEKRTSGLFLYLLLDM